MGLVFSDHGSDEFNTWGRRLAVFSADDLKRGLDTCLREHRGKGKLDLPTFMGYCQPPKVAHRPYQPPTRTPRLTDGRSLGNERFQELHKVTLAMMQEGPDGPITRATREKRLTRNFVNGKSAEEIMAFCERLYGQS